jgi:hypothetical protein
LFSGIDTDANDQSVEKIHSPVDDIGMTKRNRIERSGENTDSGHGSLLYMRVNCPTGLSLVGCAPGQTISYRLSGLHGTYTRKVPYEGLTSYTDPANLLNFKEAADYYLDLKT